MKRRKVKKERVIFLLRSYVKQTCDGGDCVL
jgi:hypothetical protein